VKDPESTHMGETGERSSGVLRILVEGTAAATGEEFFRSLARHAAQALHARYAFVAETLSPLESRSLAYWEGSDFGEGFSYRFPGTPCQNVAAGRVCSTSSGLQALFPEDVWLQQIGAHSYVGVPMKNAAGRVLGHIAVLHTEPMEPSSEDIAMLTIFASRACAELERTQAERALNEALAEVGRLRDRLQEENLYLQEEIRATHNFDEIVGRHPALMELLSQIGPVAASDAAVLIQGETGTGKELIARALHDGSTRRGRPLVKVNCGAISTGLVESELFGHVKGAFTGAVARRVGRFELAHGGTIFLDEVGELPAETQVKLLRVLQEKEFEPVGSNQTLRVDVRTIAATNRDLEQAVRQGSFRSDLYYRLNVVPLRVPPLRERREDIALLALYFLERSSRSLGKNVRGIASESLRRLTEYSWPGNVRELQNVIERAVVLAGGGPVLTLGPELLRAGAGSVPVPVATASSPAPVAPAKGAAPPAPSEPASGAPELLPLEEVERRHILATLEQCRWIIEGPEGAAAVLGLRPSTLRSRMKKLGATRAATGGSGVGGTRADEA
jgi:formate hydrogenlyase transcriptional activator